MLDVFAHYETCLEAMANKLNRTDLPEFDVLRTRLTENIGHARLYGDTPARQSDRSMVLDILNRKALSLLGTAFSALGETGAGKAAACIDVLVYVALVEEFHSVIAEFGQAFARAELADVALTVYQGTMQGPSSTASVVIVPAGAMGNTRSSGVISALLGRERVRNVVALGIAGSVGDDLQLGDVFIPQSVHEYMANVAASGDVALSFAPSGNRIPVDPRLLNRAQLFPREFPTAFRAWARRAARTRKSLVSDELQARLERRGINARGNPKVIAGDDRILGSGPAVSKGAAFTRWIREAARKIEAVEMESAGVLDAALLHTPAPRALVIRGISDYGDSRKKHIETAARGAFRQLAIRSAASYLGSVVRAGLFAP